MLKMLQTLLVGIENMGENFKKLQEDMVNWQSDYQNAEREYAQMNEGLLQEVPLSVPGVTRPETAVIPPIVSVTTSNYATIFSSSVCKCIIVN